MPIKENESESFLKGFFTVLVSVNMFLSIGFDIEISITILYQIADVFRPSGGK